MKKQFMVLLVLACSLLNSYSQQGLKPDSLILQSMDKIAFMLGNWSGTGWIQMGNTRHVFIQKETVVQKVNKAVIVIDGLGTDKETGKIIHQAFAVISYDAAHKKYLMRAYRADGNYIDADFIVENDGSIIWRFSHPQAGNIKYTIRHTGDKWIEKGEMSRDGNTWMQFFEMTLSKEL